jgi:hypothetical protein
MNKPKRLEKTIIDLPISPKLPAKPQLDQETASINILKPQTSDSLENNNVNVSANLINNTKLPNIYNKPVTTTVTPLGSIDTTVMSKDNTNELNNINDAPIDKTQDILSNINTAPIQLLQPTLPNIYGSTPNRQTLQAQNVNDIVEDEPSLTQIL